MSQRCRKAQAYTLQPLLSENARKITQVQKEKGSIRVSFQPQRELFIRELKSLTILSNSTSTDRLDISQNRVGRAVYTSSDATKQI